jgi:hypothetical protein
VSDLDDNEERLKAHLVAEALADDETKLNIGRMTVEEFRALPQRLYYNSDEGLFDGIIILPAADGDERHDSGYRVMDVIGIRNESPVCRLAGGSDHLWNLPAEGAAAAGWNIDCLPTSGLLRMWPTGKNKIKVGSAMSTLDINFVPREPSSET